MKLEKQYTFSPYRLLRCFIVNRNVYVYSVYNKLCHLWYLFKLLFVIMVEYMSERVCFFTQVRVYSLILIVLLLNLLYFRLSGGEVHIPGPESLYSSLSEFFKKYLAENWWNLVWLCIGIIIVKIVVIIIIIMKIQFCDT